MNIQAIRQAITSTLRQDQRKVDPNHVLTPQEWSDKGEQTIPGALLIILHDGSTLSPYFNMDYGCYQTSDNEPKREWDRMLDSLHSVGAWSEQQSCWYSAIFPSHS